MVVLVKKQKTYHLRNIKNKQYKGILEGKSQSSENWIQDNYQYKR